MSNNQNNPQDSKSGLRSETIGVGLPVSDKNNPQEVPQVKSVEEYYPGIQYQELFDHMSNKHGLTLLLHSEMDEIISLCDSMGSNQRIAELEKQNDDLKNIVEYSDGLRIEAEKQNRELREALEIAIKEIKYQYRQKGKLGGDILNRIEQALNPKDK